MSIQLVSRARKAGLTITPRAVFQHPTAAALASVAKPVTEISQLHLPSDRQLVLLAPAEIERLQRQYPRLEDILPLSPLQEGLLFHALYDAQGPDIYIAQIVLDLEGPLDSAALQAVAGALLRRHASLRVAIRHEDVNRPVQIIVPCDAPPWRGIDLSLLDKAERERQFARILTQDRAERFDLAAPPLMRCALIRLAAHEHRLVLTTHHMAMDGWSRPVLMQDLLTLYAQRGDAAALPPVTPYRDYLAWLSEQDRGAAVEAWREALAGLEEGTHLAPRAVGRAPVAPEQLLFALSEPLTAALTQQARSRGLTLNTIIQAAWGLLLGRLTGRSDVVFGVTVAGRPPEIAGIERMVGLFINTLPLRLRLVPGRPLHRLLAELQESQSRLMAHQHLGLAEIQGLTGLGELFDTLVVFENYPVDQGGPGIEAGGLRLTHASGHDAAHYPLALESFPASRYRCGSTTGPTCSCVRARRRWRSGSFGCWRRRQRRRSVRSGGSMFSVSRSARPSCTSGTTPRTRSRRRPCRSCSPRRLRAHPMRSRWCAGKSASATASLRPAPTSWRITCAGSASAPKWWWGCAWSARPR